MPVAPSAKEIERASFDDEELRMVKSCVKSGNWSHCKAAVFFQACQGGTIHLRRTFASWYGDSHSQYPA